MTRVGIVCDILVGLVPEVGVEGHQGDPLGQLMGIEAAVLHKLFPYPFVSFVKGIVPNVGHQLIIFSPDVCGILQRCDVTNCWQ